MSQMLLVALGGAVGSVARYSVGLAAVRLLGTGWPWGTLAVNVLGGLAMGLLAARTGAEQENVRLLLGVGALGGFTTFSAFSLETMRLLQQSPTQALLYVLASVVLAVGACWLGYVLGRV
jgi:CrcB protein